ncbi:hypothetical protein, partial [Prosthecochloris ethylica]|uniref:hypothetical protein n=1 Tax=Prosthecochloris ethylica TaxID=2743976 RepID=UPI001A935243
ARTEPSPITEPARPLQPQNRKKPTNQFAKIREIRRQSKTSQSKSVSSVVTPTPARVSAADPYGRQANIHESLFVTGEW